MTRQSRRDDTELGLSKDLNLPVKHTSAFIDGNSVRYAELSKIFNTKSLVFHVVRDVSHRYAPSFALFAVSSDISAAFIAMSSMALSMNHHKRLFG